MEMTAPVWRRLVAVLALGIVSRAAMLVWVGTARPDGVTYDFLHSEMARVGHSLAAGSGFASPFSVPTGETAWVAPGYPFLMSLIFREFHGYSRAASLAMLGMSCFFSVLTCIPVFFLAREWGGDKLGLWAAAGWALFPYAIHLSGTRFWEQSFSPLLMMLLLCIALAIRRTGQTRFWLLWGALIGCTALTATTVIVVAPFLAFWIGAELHRRKIRWISNAALACLVSIAIVTPWLVRDYRSFGRFVPVRSNFWMEVSVGNQLDPGVDWAGWMHPSRSPQQFALYQQLGEIRYMDLKRSEALAWIRAYPGVFAARTLKRFMATWTGAFEFPLHGDDLSNAAFCTSLTILALVGLWLAATTRHREIWLFVIPLAAYPCIYYLTVAHERYRHPIDPIVVILAASAALEFQAAYSSLRARWRLARMPVVESPLEVPERSGD